MPSIRQIPADEMNRVLAALRSAAVTAEMRFAGRQVVRLPSNVSIERLLDGVTDMSFARKREIVSCLIKAGFIEASRNRSPESKKQGGRYVAMDDFCG